MKQGKNKIFRKKKKKIPKCKSKENKYIYGEQK